MVIRALKGPRAGQHRSSYGSAHCNDHRKDWTIGRQSRRSGRPIVIGFVEDKLPGPIAAQLDGLMGGGADAGEGAGMMDSVKKGLGGPLGG